MTPYQADFSFDNFQRCQLSSPWWFVFIFFAHGGWWETAHFNIFGSCKHHEKFPHVLWGSLNLQTFRRIPCENSSGWTSVGVRHQVYAMMTTCNLEADTDGPPERKWMVFKGCCRGFSDFRGLLKNFRISCFWMNLLKMGDEWEFCLLFKVTPIYQHLPRGANKTLRGCWIDTL